MMLRKSPVLLLPFLLAFPTISHGAPDEPSNYDECILDTMRGVSSDVAARAILESCRKLFPESPPGAASPVIPTTATPPAVNADATPAAQVAAPIAAAPLDTTSARSLTADELGRLRSTAKVFGSAYRVTIENDNPDLTVTEVTIAVWDDADSPASRKEYSETVRIPPQSSELVKYTVHYRGEDASWNWGVVGARGVE
jgi:hypothetical protein